MLEKLFHLSEKNSSVKTEIIAGVTTFLAMAYILAVNPGILGESGMDMHSVFMATALSAGFASIVMGLFANYPVALAPGMGVNALFTYTVVFGMGHTWQAALAAVFVSGLIFLVISVTGIRKMIINAIPQQLKLAIGAGIGFFIAFVGLKNAGIIIASESTAVALGSFSEPTVLLAIFGILVTIALAAKKVPAAVFVGMVITAVTGIVLGTVGGLEGMPALASDFVTTDFSMNTIGSFTEGFSDLFADPFNAFIVIFSFLFVDFFDTAGTLVAIGNRCGLINEKGELENAERALLADAVGTVAGAALGTSTVTSFVESSSGVEVGGRTGLTAITTGVLFFLSIFVSPIVLSAATNAVTAPALVVVGILMAQQLGGVDWNDFVFATAGFITILMMILTYSISNGIALGFVTYGIAMIATGKGKEVSPIIWGLDVIFIFYFFSLTLL
ncbi:MAG: NCS2 family permease [Erysipelotrichaceae bacterium]|jgi:AGZA family xanthine/uracil permease-like MFS transporter|nr:NCS2 family permease [Erysipelotrichaceae bacterium]